MTILIVTESVNFSGGAELIAGSTAYELAKRGHRVILFGGIGDPEHCPYRHPNLTIESVFPAGPPAIVRRVIVESSWRKETRAKLASVLADLPNDAIVHVHNGFVNLSASVFGLLTSRPRIFFTHHDYVATCPAVGQYHWKEKRICPLVGGSKACFDEDCMAAPLKQKRAMVVMNRYAFRMTGFLRRAHHVFVGEGSAEFLRSRLHLNRWTVLHNPVEATDLGPRPPVLSDAAFLVIGRLAPEKNPVLAAEAARRAGVRIRFIGTGPEEEEILRVNPDAEMLGQLDRQAIQDQLRTCRATILASRWYEGWPLTMRESLAAGVPVLCSDAIIEAGRIDPSRNGCLFANDDVESLRLAIETITPAVSDRLGRIAYDDFWRDPPTMERYVDRLEALYREDARVAGPFR